MTNHSILIHLLIYFPVNCGSTGEVVSRYCVNWGMEAQVICSLQYKSVWTGSHQQ